MTVISDTEFSGFCHYWEKICIVNFNELFRADAKYKTMLSNCTENCHRTKHNTLYGQKFVDNTVFCQWFEHGPLRPLERNVKTF